MNLPYVKGHGTENDFILIPDLLGELDISGQLVRALCDRHRGLGADGVIRIVRTHALPEGAMQPEAEWFMDYRNADGSVAEMCGNGIRVMARYLQDKGFVTTDEFCLGTRAGVKNVSVLPDGEIVVNMGAPEILDAQPVVLGQTATALSMGNPHVVVPLGEGRQGLTALQELDLRSAPQVLPSLPNGQNVGFVVRTGHREFAARIYERGVGETPSCGTAICASAVATVINTGEGRGEPWVARVPGGRLTIEWTQAGPVLLTGPAVLVAEGEFRSDWVETMETTEEVKVGAA